MAHFVGNWNKTAYPCTYMTMHKFTSGFRDVDTQGGVEGFFPDAIGPQHITWQILGLRPPNERRHY